MKYLNGIFLLLAVHYVHSANILFVTMIPAASHQSVYQPIWRELSLRGHNVHVLTSKPLNNRTLTNLTEYDFSFLFDFVNNISDIDYMLRKPNFPTVFIRDIIVTSIVSHATELIFQREEMYSLLNKTVKFDVAIVEWMFLSMTALAAKYDCPLIGILSCGMPLVGLDAIGNPSHPITNPDHDLPTTRAMPFRERLMSVLYSFYVRFWYRTVVLRREDKIVKKYLGENLPYLGDIQNNVSIVILNQNVIFHRVMPTVPGVIQLGSIKRDRSNAILSSDMKSFLDNSPQGVIYFSLGSVMKMIYLPQHIRELFLAVFRQLPYNVLLKWENDTIPGKPDNVFISKWIPQTAVLEHPNTKVFLTQGGLQSAEEAILAEIPIIGLPTQSDQTTNVDSFVHYGVGIGLDLEDITIEILNSSIHEVLKNPVYKQNARKLAKLMYDQPVDGLQRAVWWIEYVIRHKGARFLRSSLVDTPWWKYFMLDVVGFLLLVLSVFFLILYYMLRALRLAFIKIYRLYYKKDEWILEKKLH